MLLVKVSWAEAIWGLPFLTVLCPWGSYLAERIRRWLPYRELIFVGDSSFAALDLLGCVSFTSKTSLITRLRMDAEL
jgi:hypothetical protein